MDAVSQGVESPSPDTLTLLCLGDANCTRRSSAAVADAFRRRTSRYVLVYLVCVFTGGGGSRTIPPSILRVPMSPLQEAHNECSIDYIEQLLLHISGTTDCLGDTHPSRVLGALFSARRAALHTPGTYYRIRARMKRLSSWRSAVPHSGPMFHPSADFSSHDESRFRL